VIDFWLKDRTSITISQLFDESYDKKENKSSKFLQIEMFSVEKQ
jgi:hypothetical protein